jgi:hypothetical protein
MPTTVEEFRELLKRAAKGDESTLPAVRKMLEDPANIERFGGDLARYAQRSFVNAITEENLTLREAIHAKLAAIRKDLLGENPTAIEVLLVERIAACWLQVQEADIRSVSTKDASFRQADFNLRRMDAANRRYLAALKALALVRKLAVPALQINVARKQVNVVASAPVNPATS